MKNLPEIHESVQIPESYSGKRLDLVLAELFPTYSRMRLKQWIEQKEVMLNGKPTRPKEKVHGGEFVTIQATLPKVTENQPEEITLDVIYEDDDILVINKPVGLVVHPGAGNQSNTLLNALLYHDPNLAKLPRAGIVHRIDKDTTGLLVVAKTIEAHHALVKQLKKHQIEREYEAVVYGELISGGTIDQPISRDPHQRIKMAIVEEGKESITHYRIIERFNGFTLLKVMLETGRTHQIRVHMASIHHPLVGDPIYGGRFKMPKGLSENAKEMLKSFKRQALHARRLTLTHPNTREKMTFSAQRPNDMMQLIQSLKEL